MVSRRAEVRGQILNKVLGLDDAITKAELSRKIGVSLSTVCTNVDVLEAQGKVYVNRINSRCHLVSKSK